MDTQSITSTLTPYTDRGGRNLSGRGCRGRLAGRFAHRGRGVERARGRGRVNTTYYSPTDWNRLSPAQRAQELNARGTKQNISDLISDYLEYPLAHEEVGFDNDNNDITDDIPQEVLPENARNIASLNSDTLEMNSVAMSTTSGNQFGQRSRSHFHDDSHFIGMMKSSHRTLRPSTLMSIANVQTMEQENTNVLGFLELVSHADTCCIGANCRIIT
jgi:hypothetical protein